MSLARATLAVLAQLTAAAGVSVAGPLNPPPGPIAPTPSLQPRTAINLTNTPGDADSLFRITQPGSYYLPGNVIGAAAKHGIEIAVGGVTIDLNGFVLSGVPGSLSGIVSASANFHAIEIHSGIISEWGSLGIDLTTNAALGSTLTNLRVARNGAVGMRTGNGAVVTGCVAVSNTASGISAGNGCTVSHCSAIGNGFVGLIANAGGSFDHCTATGNVSRGIESGTAATVTGCAAYDNGADGIVAGAGSVVIGNSSRDNESDGIVVSSACLVLNNMSYSNDDGGAGGAGIRVTGGDNRVEGNNCGSQGVGIDVDSGGNIIIRNTCAGNTSNWEIAANNYYGPIVNRVGIGTIAASGNSAASTLNTTDPNANFSY